MPEMNGLEVLKILKEQRTATKVLMFSTYTTVGAKHTFEALELGAADFVPKPSSSGFSKKFEKIRDELIAKIKFVGSSASPSPVSMECSASRWKRYTMNINWKTNPLRKPIKTYFGRFKQVQKSRILTNTS